MNQVVKLFKNEEDLIGFFYFRHQAAEAIVTLGEVGQYKVETFKVINGKEHISSTERFKFSRPTGLEEVETVTYPKR